MKAWSVIGLLFAATIFAMVPISPQVTPRGVELSVDQAQAITYRRARVTARRVGDVRIGAQLTQSAQALLVMAWARTTAAMVIRPIPHRPHRLTELAMAMGRITAAKLSSLQLCWLRLSGLWLWRLLPAGLSHCPPGGDPSGPLALRAWGILIAVRMGAPGCKPELGAF